MAGFFNSFRFDENGELVQFDEIINGNSPVTQEPAPEPAPEPGPEPGPGPEPEPPVDPYNPLGLPPYTIRVKYATGKTPTMGDSQTLVDATENIWDITKNSTRWNQLFQTKYSNEVLQVLGANTSDVTAMSGLFDLQSNLTNVAVFDTRNVTDMSSMFYKCTALTAVPLLPTDSCEIMGLIFMNCYNVESGALAFYQQASSQASVRSYPMAFTDCGKNTATGAAELAQIPASWGGTAE